MIRIVPLLLLVFGCSSSALPSGGGLVFKQMCDASGAVPLSSHTFAVADDEDNVIRIYDAQRGGDPLRAIDLSQALKLPVSGKKQRPAELDLEAAARIGTLAFWMTSHGLSSSGKLKPERHRFFATRVSTGQNPFELVGEAYEELVADLIADARYARFGLAEASKRAPKSEGGLNIEGMAARAAGGLYIGFRSPVPDGKALIATLLNPEEMVMKRERARFGEPILLDLGGLGIRDLSDFRGRYLVLAGSRGEGTRSELHVWDGGRATELVARGFGPLNPEVIFSPSDRLDVLLLSDDGTERIDGEECKRLRSRAQKRFRGVWLRGNKLTQPSG
jgi:hypothetical protein